MPEKKRKVNFMKGQSDWPWSSRQCTSSYRGGGSSRRAQCSVQYTSVLVCISIYCSLLQLLCCVLGQEQFVRTHSEYWTGCWSNGLRLQPTSLTLCAQKILLIFWKAIGLKERRRLSIEMPTINRSSHNKGNLLPDHGLMRYWKQLKKPASS